MPKDFMEGYVSVAERTGLFFDKHPNGRIQCSRPEIMEVGGKLYIWVQASVWREVDDPLPSIASAWEEFPGPTQFTKNSEMMNAETSAVGRALAWLGIEVRRGVSSSDEHRNAPPAPSDWRERFMSACVEAKVDVTDVCLLASENKLSLPRQFKDEERFKLAEALATLKSGVAPVAPEGGAEGGIPPSATLGSRARK